MGEVKEKTMTMLTAIKIVGGGLTAIVGILVSISQINSMMDRRINTALDDRFEKKVIEKQEEVGFDAIKRFRQIEIFTDSLKQVFPDLILLTKDEEYSVSGLYVNKHTKERFYIDKNGIRREVFKTASGELKFYDGELRTIYTP